MSPESISILKGNEQQARIYIAQGSARNLNMKALESVYRAEIDPRFILNEDRPGEANQFLATLYSKLAEEESKKELTRSFEAASASTKAQSKSKKIESAA